MQMARFHPRLLFVAAAAAFGPAAAQEAASPPLELPGGIADITPSGEFYRGLPRPAAPMPGTACVVAQRYLELINAGRYAEVSKLFAANAVVLEPMRGTARGTAEIDAFYSRRIGAMRPHVIGVAYLGDRRHCMLENAARVPPSPRYRLSSINHLTLDSRGKIMRMVAFARPSGTPRLP
jgi:hypothetical protein